MTAKFIRHIASILLFSFILALSSCASQTVNTDVNTESEYESESKETEKVSNDTNSSDEADTDEPSFETEEIKNESSECESSATEPQKQYTVSFDLNFDGSPDAKKQQVNEGERADIPTTPVRDGFVFSGWYTDRACTSLFDFSEKTDADITLYALWKGEEYLKDIQEQRR